MKARHLHFVQSVDPAFAGGIFPAAAELSQALASSGSPSYLVGISASASLPPKLQGEVFRPFGPKRAYFSWEMFLSARKLVSNAEIINGHGFYVAPNWIFGSEARRQGKPLVYHVHGIFEPWLLDRSRYKKRVAHLLFENDNFKSARLWRALTTKEADQIRAQGISGEIVICPNGVDLAPYGGIEDLRRKREKTKERRVLLFLARIHPQKGLDLLVEAWALVPERLRRDWRVIIAGPDEIGQQAQLETSIKRAHLKDDFQFIGPVSGQQKLHVLADADAFILPSRSEGFSMAVLEAMACRLPVVITDACNFPEVEQRGTGWCATVAAESIKENLLKLFASSESDLQAKSRAGYDLIVEKYTWSSIARNFDSACKSIVHL